MQQLTVRIPDSRVPFFIELARNLGIEVAPDNSSTESSPALSAAQIELVEAERQKIKDNPDYLLDWEDARKTLRLD